MPGCKEATAAAPSVLDHLCADCETQFQSVQRYLKELSLPYAVNPRMVRGLDYYTKTTFELVTDRLGAQSAVAAGGRYDGLIKDLGGPALPGIGFAMGVERLVLLKESDRIEPATPDLFLAALGEEAADRAFVLMSELQRQGIRAEMGYQGKSLKAQMRRADKLGSRFALILGEEELQNEAAPLRNMSGGDQQNISLSGGGEELAKRLRCLLDEA